MITVEASGDFSKTEKFLKAIGTLDVRSTLEKYAKRGVEALRQATPVDTSRTANSWGYEISVSKKGASIYWTNSNVQNGVPIAIILQYGHATGNGGYVSGRDYINPAMRGIFDTLANEVWMEVTKK